MDMMVTVTLDGTPRQVPLTEATVLSLAQRALSGNTAAAREFMRIAEKIAAKQEIEDLPRIGLIHLHPMVPVEVNDSNEALRKLGVIEQVVDRWRIRPWVIEAALARDGQLLSDEKDRQLVAENMVDGTLLERILSK
jgi:hypothetical protein